MSLFKVRHYVVYRNEVLFVNPAEWTDGKWRRALPPKVEVAAFLPAQIAYQAPAPVRIRVAVRRIRHVSFDSDVSEDRVVRFIRGQEGVDRRVRLHDAERAMKEAERFLGAALAARARFRLKLKDGIYGDGQNGTDAALKADRSTSAALDRARSEALCAAVRLYPMLVGLGTITWEECERRIDRVRFGGGVA